MRLWLVTMGASLLIWAASAAFALTLPVQIALGAVLVVLFACSGMMTRRGKCPRCGHQIRFAPRIELPLVCGHCGVSFHTPEVRSS